jgi:putative endonuclease
MDSEEAHAGSGEAPINGREVYPRLAPSAADPPPRLAPSAVDRRQRVGRAGEQLACAHLERRGFQIVDRNYRTRFGELDIIAFDGRTLVFCEVKSRLARKAERMPRAGAPLEAVHPRKRAQVRRIARRWLVERAERPRAPVLRFDAIGVTFDADERLLALEHVEGAF